MQLFLKILNGMANRVDPDQTAPEGQRFNSQEGLKEQSDLGLHCLPMPFCQTIWCSKFWDIYSSKVSD